MSRILITGSSGFVGGEIIRQAVSLGHQVVALKRATSKVTHLEQLPIEWRIADVTQEEQLKRAFEGIEYCIHTAGDTSYFLKDRKALERTNVVGVQTLMNVAKSAGVKRVVHTSSVAAIGYDSNGQPVDETCEFNWPRGLVYMETKRLGEQVALGSATSSFEVVAVNPATIFGPGTMNASEQQFLEEVERKNTSSIPPGGMTVCDVADVALGHLLALERGRSGERYILGGHHVKHHELMLLIAKAMSISFEGKPLPCWLVRTAGALAYWAESCGVSMELPSAMVRLSAWDIYHSSDKAISELGYKPRPLAELVERVVNYRKLQKGNTQ